MPSLDVYFFDEKVGVLTEKNSRLSFKYLETASRPISLALPLQKEAFDDRWSRGFFENLLPEGDLRKIIAKLKGFSANNPFAFLREFGEECAGAVSLHLSGLKKKETAKPVLLLKKDLDELFENRVKVPMLVGEDVRLSLAGAQDKIALICKGGEFYIPNSENVSTHIIKPDNLAFEGLVYNEYFCMILAKILGFEVAECDIEETKKGLYYCTKRYDRGGKRAIKRVHQEDFCQALGLMGKKYQKDGGPSIKQCFKLIENHSVSPLADKMQFLRLTVFNFVIGNSDAHGKNFSFLYTKQGIKLAPFYDLVSTQVYPKLSKSMAMSIGGEYNPDKISRRHFMKMAEEIGVGEEVLEETLAFTLQNVEDAAEWLFEKFDEKKMQKTAGSIRAIIKKRIKQTIK